MQELFGPLVAGRDCGGCTVCCVHLKIDEPELKKAAGVPCEYRTDKGCGIYETRFPICRSWHCLWRHIGAMPDEARPDHLGIVFVLANPKDPGNVFDRCYIHALAFDGRAAAESKLAQGLFEMFTQGDLPLWVSTHESDRELLYPDAETARAVLSGKQRWKLPRRAKEWMTGIRQKPKHGWRYFLKRVSAR